VSFAFRVLKRFRFTCCHLKIVQGGIFLRKMPDGSVRSVKSRIETAVARIDPNSTALQRCDLVSLIHLLFLSLKFANSGILNEVDSVVTRSG
jgi:hypothetical protein